MTRIAIAVLLISPLLVLSQVQHTPSFRTPTAKGYHQHQDDGDIFVGLVTDPSGTDFKPYLENVVSAMKSKGVRWPASDPRRMVVIEGAISRNGALSKLNLDMISPVLTADDASRLDMSGAKFVNLLSAVTFPALPDDFSGDQILVHFIFMSGRPR